MDETRVQAWLDAYVAAWRSTDPAAIGALFTDDVRYQEQPYEEPTVGRDAVVASWVADPDPPESWTAAYVPFALEGARAVATGVTSYTNPDGSHRETFHNVFLLEFADDGRCARFVEYYRRAPG